MSKSLACAFAVLALGVMEPLSALAQEPVPAATSERGAPPPLSVYGSLPSLSMVDISPDGTKLAYVTVVGEMRSMLVAEIPSGRLIGGARIGAVKVRSLDWVGSDHILLETSYFTAPMPMFQRSEYWQGLIYSIADKDLTPVFNRMSGVYPMLAGGTYIRDVDGRPSIIAEGMRSDFKPALYRIDPATGRGPVIREPGREEGGQIIDGAGEILGVVEYDSDTDLWSLKALSENGGRRVVWNVEAPLDQPGVWGLGRTPGTVIVDTNGRNPPGQTLEPGQTSVFEVNLATGAWERLSFDEDPLALVAHPVTGLLIGATFDSPRGPRQVFFDPAAERAWNSIRRAFPNHTPAPVAWSDDMRKIIVYSGGIGDSGVYQLVDLDRRAADIVGEAYPAVGTDWVGEVRTIEYKAADGMTIPAILTLPPGVEDPKKLPLVVLPHGGPEAHDSVGFDWWSQALASRGYAVLQPNFRGSTGYGRAHTEAGHGQWGRKMQTDLSDGVRHLAAEGLIDPERVCIVGASYGGYAALAGMTVDSGVYRCAVSVAGVADLREMVQWSRRGGERDSGTVRYWNRFMGAEALGDRTLDEVSPSFLAERVQGPILLIHGKDDTVVPIQQSRIMARALERAGKPFELVEMEGEDHWLSRSTTREAMLTATARFVEQHNPPD